MAAIKPRQKHAIGGTMTFNRSLLSSAMVHDPWLEVVRIAEVELLSSDRFERFGPDERGANAYDENGLQRAVAHAKQHPSVDVRAECPIARRELTARHAAGAWVLKHKAMDEQKGSVKKLPPGIAPPDPNRL